jgi:DNA-binding SARP family transcriptional activator
MLGPFKVQRDERDIPTAAWGSQQTRTILKVLLTRRRHVVAADQLEDILWPDDDPETARNRLHVRISQLRRALDPETPSACVLTHRGGYSFAPKFDCSIDVDEFESHARRGRQCYEGHALDEAIAAYESAIALYQGDFLEEDLYEDWTLAERERLRECYLTALTELAECYARQGRYRHAISRCHQVLAIDACREVVYARLMLYHFHAGEQSQALRTYARCRQILADELAVDPLPQTTALYEQLLRQNTTTDGHYPQPSYEKDLAEIPHSLSQMPFVGREDRHALLVTCVDRSIDGDGALVLVSGKAGTGKTRLIQEALKYARHQGTLTLEGRCFELGSALSYEPLIQALRSYVTTADTQSLGEMPGLWLSETATLLPELHELFPDLPHNAPLPPEHRMSRLFEGIAQFIIHISHWQPVTVFIDDLHWAGRPTLELLHYIVHRIANERVLLIGTLRSEEVTEECPLNEMLRSVSKEQIVAQFELPSLTEQAVTDLVAQMACSPSEISLFAQRLYRETEGNALFIAATLQDLFEKGLAQVDEEGRWVFDKDVLATDKHELGIPPTVQEVIGSRLARLSKPSRRLLDMASVLGQEFGPGDLQETSNWADEKLLEAIDDLLHRGLIQEGAGEHEYQFGHAKVREVTYAGLDGPRRAILHRKVGQVLEERHRNSLERVAERLVQHFRLAGEPARTVKYAIIAGQETLRTCAHQDALKYFQLASLTAERAERPLTRAQHLAVQRGSGDAHWMAGRYDLARACYEKALSFAETPVEMDDLGFKAAYLDAQRGAPISSLLQRAEVFESTLQSKEYPLVETRHYLHKGYTLLVQGTAEPARQCYQQSWDIISNLAHSPTKEPYTFDLAEAHRSRAEAHLYWGEYDQCACDLERALSLYHEIGHLPGTMRTRLHLGELLVHTGPWDSAQAEFAQVIDTATRVEHRALLAEGLFRLGYVHCDQGEWELAESEAARSLEIAAEVGDLVSQSGAQFLLNRLMIKRGQAEEALPSCQAMELAMRALDSGLFLCLALRYLAQAYVGLEEPDRVLSHCCEGLDLARKASFRREIGAIQRVCAQALMQQDKWDEAKVHLQASIEQLERIGCLYELGESHRTLGRLYLDRGAQEKAHGHLMVASALFEELGAARDVASVRQLLSKAKPQS